MLPCVFALLTGKSEDIYKKLLVELKDGALRNSFELKPESSTYLKYYNINAGTFKRKHRSNKDIKRDENLLKCKFELVTNKVDMMEYLNRVSNLIHDYSVINTLYYCYVINSICINISRF